MSRWTVQQPARCWIALTALLLAVAGCEADVPQPRDTPDPQLQAPTLSAQATARLFLERARAAGTDPSAIREVIDRHVEPVGSDAVEQVEQRMSELISELRELVDDGYEIAIADGRERNDKAVAILQLAAMDQVETDFEPIYLRRVDGRWRVNAHLTDFDRREPQSEADRETLEAWRALEQWYEQRKRELI